MSFHPKGYNGIPSNPDYMLLKLCVSLHKLTTRPYCRRQHQHNALNTKKSIWCLHRAFTLEASFTDSRRHSVYYQRRNINTDPPLFYKAVLHA